MLPERFDLTYVGEDGQKHRPVMVHRVILGSVDRFIGILVEHCAGAFPLWMAPEQARLMPIAERHVDHCRGLKEKFQATGIKVWVDGRNEKIGYKIREAQMQKIPYMLVVGDQEVQNGRVNVRKHGEGKEGSMSTYEFINIIHEEIKNKSFPPHALKIFR